MKIFPKIAVVVLLALGFGGHIAWSQTAGTTGTTGIYVIKHRSEFSYTSPHNPFCPIGWVRGADPTQNTAVAETVAPISANNFVVSGISISPTPIALINNKECAEGETIEARYGDQILKIKVLRINDGSVVLQYQNKAYTIPLKHPTLSSESAPKEEVQPQQERPMLLH
ncbi:MAG: hypothetical protein WCD79_13455 [Chthoniobacteraceae bacterium]